MGTGFIDRDEVVSGTWTEPLHIDVVVRYDDRLSSGELFFANQPGDDLRRHEMGADRDVGLVLLRSLINGRVLSRENAGRSRSCFARFSRSS